MSDTEPERLDAPNQQVVREDESGPADEGSGGATAARAGRAAARSPSPRGRDERGDDEAT